jgi:hypothetical protein
MPPEPHCAAGSVKRTALIWKAKSHHPFAVSQPPCRPYGPLNLPRPIARKPREIVKHRRNELLSTMILRSRRYQPLPS